MAYTTINKSTDYFNTVLYTGNGTAIGSGGKTVTGVGFQPDFVWGKARSGTDAVDNHELTDAVRGVTKYLKCNNNSAETTSAESLTSFTNDGFILGNNGQMNRNGNNCVAWNWKANGQGSSNTAGSINTTYTSVNTTAGFSISKYTGTTSAGATVGHGLGVAPSMIITKNLGRSGGAGNWVVYHKSLGNTKYLLLNESNAEGSSSGAWNNTTPTSSVFTVGDFDSTNGSEGMIAYCFAEKTGYSKFGSYTGNGNADGTFIYTGFKPAFYIIKRTSDTFSWIIKDNKRPGYNVNGSYLVANTNGAEATGSGNVAIDEYSNGFKIRGTSDALNGSGQPYIYMAFGQSLVGSNNVPCTAR